MGNLEQQNAAHLAVNEGRAQQLQESLRRANEAGKQFVQFWYGSDGTLHMLRVDQDVVSMVQGATNNLMTEVNKDTRSTNQVVDPWDMHTWPENSF